MKIFNMPWKLIPLISLNVTLYEVRSNDKDQNSVNFPKIYTSYCTEKNTYELKQIPGVHATNPTRSGLQLLVTA